MMKNRLFRIRGQSDRSQRYKGQARRIDAQPLIYTKKRESSKKGKRGFPLGAVNGKPPGFPLTKRTAYGRAVPALARLSSRSGGAYEQPTGLFT